jgi:hypothetical protein
LGAEFRVEAKLKEGVQLIGGFEKDSAASSAIAAGRAPARHKLLTAKRRHPVTAVSALHEYFGPIQELHGALSAVRRQATTDNRLLLRVHADELALAALLFKLNDPRHEGKEGVVGAPTHIVARLEFCATLSDEDLTTKDALTSEALHA